MGRDVWSIPFVDLYEALRVSAHTSYDPGSILHNIKDII